MHTYFAYRVPGLYFPMSEQDYAEPRVIGIQRDGFIKSVDGFVASIYGFSILILANENFAFVVPGLSKAGPSLDVVGIHHNGFVRSVDRFIISVDGFIILALFAKNRAFVVPSPGKRRI